MNDASMADCTKASYDVVAACGALAVLASVNSPYTPAFAKIVADIRLACKKECDKFPQYVECKDMGASCKGVNLKIVLGQIDADSDKLFHGRSPSLVELSGYHVLGALTPLRRGRPHHQIGDRPGMDRLPDTAEH